MQRWPPHMRGTHDGRFFIDFPTAWAIASTLPHTSPPHHRRCSTVPGWDPISGPGFLCDCGVMEREWERLINTQENGA